MQNQPPLTALKVLTAYRIHKLKVIIVEKLGAVVADEALEDEDETPMLGFLPLPRAEKIPPSQSGLALRTHAPSSRPPWSSRLVM
jgi:hypothetical protein